MGKGEVNSAFASTDPAIRVKNLDFNYPGGPNVLDDVSFDLEPGSRTLLVGGNGAGKTTLLRILGGKHMHDDDAVFVLGKNAFRDTTLNFERQYMDTNWGLRTVAFAGTGVAYTADIPVSQMMTALQNEFPERRDHLYKLLGVDPDWRMHKVSDGQRRRVQMFLGLLRPFKVLFLDEVTAVLDLVCRQDLLAYLKQECEERGCTIVYATHIFDGLDEWATHCVYMKAHPDNGRIGYFGPMKEIPKFQELLAAGSPSPLMGTIEFWLREELQIARERGLKEGESGATVHPDNFSIRLAGQMALESMDEEKKKEWMAKKEARESAMAAIKAVVEDSGMSVDEKDKRLREMKKAGAFNAIGGSHQAHLVLTEALAKLPRKKTAPMVSGFGSGHAHGYQ